MHSIMKTCSSWMPIAAAIEKHRVRLSSNCFKQKILIKILHKNTWGKHYTKTCFQLMYFLHTAFIYASLMNWAHQFHALISNIGLCWVWVPCRCSHKTAYHLGLSRKLYYWFAQKELHRKLRQMNWICQPRVVDAPKRILLEDASIPFISHLVFHSIFNSEDYDLRVANAIAFHFKVRASVCSGCCLFQCKCGGQKNNQVCFYL